MAFARWHIPLFFKFQQVIRRLCVYFSKKFSSCKNLHVSVRQKWHQFWFLARFTGCKNSFVTQLYENSFVSLEKNKGFERSG